MENQVVDTLALGGSVNYDMTIWGLFLEADIVVKLVLLLLVAASFWTWAVIFEKIIRMRRLRGYAERFEEAFWSGGSLDELYEDIDREPQDPMSSIFVSAMREWHRSADRVVGSAETKASLQQRIERVMQITLGREMERLERHMIFLA